MVHWNICRRDDFSEVDHAWPAELRCIVIIKNNDLDKRFFRFKLSILVDALALDSKRLVNFEVGFTSFEFDWIFGGSFTLTSSPPDLNTAFWGDFEVDFLDLEFEFIFKLFVHFYF